MHYKNTKETLPQIARELNVDGVVEGGVVRSGSRVRVTVQLIRAATDQHLWARSFERDMSDIVTLQRDLSLAMSDAIHVQFTSHVPVRHVDPKAYELYLQGNAAIAKQTAEGINEAIMYLQKA